MHRKIKFTKIFTRVKSGLVDYRLDFSRPPYFKKKKKRFDFPGSSDDKVYAYNAGEPGSIPGLGRSSGEGNGNPLQYSHLENPMDGGAW